MKKIVKIAGIATLISMAVMSIAGCTPKHTHVWEWRRSETEHWEVCVGKDCGEERNRGSHAEGEDFVCADCAEFRAISFGFVDCKGVQGVDNAHEDFAEEANVWFAQKGKEFGFIYDSVDTYKSGWSALNEDNLENYDLIMLLNDKPGTNESRKAFKDYMDNGGACLAFHAAGFAMWFEDENDPFKAPSEFDDWFSNTLMRSSVYGYCDRDPDEPIKGTYWNTWNPTSEPMKIETHDHFVTENIEVDEFISAPCEWYEWHNDLFEDDGTTVLVSMNPTPENPAGDDNRASEAHQIWYAGHHAIAWASNDYKFVYMNWGHNLQSYNLSTGSTRGESSTFESEVQNQITLNAMFGLTKNN